MSKQISDNTRLSVFLTNLLAGQYIDRVSYFITGWEFRLTTTGANLALYAAEVTVPNLDGWWKNLEQAPLDLRSGNEPNDTIAAILVFHVVNSFPIREVTTLGQGSLQFDFSDGTLFSISGEVPIIDLSWELNIEIWGRHSKWDNLLTCSFGEVFGNPEAFEKADIPWDLD